MMRPKIPAVVALSMALTGLSGAAPGPPRAGAGEGAPMPRSLDVACAELTPAAARGRLIFRAGRTAGGRPIEGVLGGGPAALVGADAACGSCHGPSGSGAEEGGVVVPPLTSERLAGADPAALGAAITGGRALSSRGLNAAMPRYRLDGAALDDLIAYLRCVGHDRDPGVTDDVIRLGAALPLTGPRSPIGEGVRAVLSAAFADAAAQGGIFGRRLELITQDTGASAGSRGAEDAAARLLEAGVFAFVASAGRPRSAPGAARVTEEVPVVAPLGSTDGDAGESVFSLYPGPETLARIAVKQIADRAQGGKPGAPRLAVAYAVGDAGARWAKGAEVEAARRQLAAPAVRPFQPGHLDAEAMAADLAQRGATALLFSGGAEDLAACVRALPGAKQVQIFAPLDAEEGSWTFDGEAAARVFFVYPGLLGARLGPRYGELFAFLQRHRIDREHLPWKAHAYVAAQTLSEALKRAGARPTRRGLLQALETLRDFDAGPAPPLSYGKGRRTGIMGAWIVQVDPVKGSISPMSTWMGIAP